MKKIIEMATKDFPSKSAFARAVGVTPQTLREWELGIKPIPCLRCSQIEKISGEAVKRWDLRPNDWWQIWPELIAHPDAPPIPAELQVATTSKGFQLCFPDQAHAVREVNHG